LRNQLEIKEPTVPYRSVNPATGEVLKTFPEHTDEQMWSALAKADKAFRAWAARPFSERSKIIGRSAQILLEKGRTLSSCHIGNGEEDSREPRRSGTQRFDPAVLRG
jgi:acyl-CoA reductase-like NAD-dependent aldehyde dehydrogenase